MNVQEEIRKLAYDFYERSGRIGGMELEHWLRAEQIVMAKLSAHGKLAATGLETEKTRKMPAAGLGTKAREAQPASRKNIGTAPELQKTRKTGSTASVSAKPRKTQKKTVSKSGEKAKKTKS